MGSLRAAEEAPTEVDHPAGTCDLQGPGRPSCQTECGPGGQVPFGTSGVVFGRKAVPTRGCPRQPEGQRGRWDEGSLMWGRRRNRRAREGKTHESRGRQTEAATPRRRRWFHPRSQRPPATAAQLSSPDIRRPDSGACARGEGVSRYEAGAARRGESLRALRGHRPRRWREARWAKGCRGGTGHMHPNQWHCPEVSLTSWRAQPSTATAAVAFFK